MFRVALFCSVVGIAVLSAGCQHPTSPDDVDSFDDAADVTATPNPIQAEASTDGRTYRVVRGNNQPDEILTSDWHAAFTTRLVINSTATSDDVDVTFPLRLTATTVVVKQASGGIITTPTGGETEKFDFLISANGNQIAAVGGSLTTAYEVWYDLPSLRKEAVVTVTFTFIDADNATFTKAEEFTIAP